MLIEFSVENFRSFRSRQTLSMVAASRLRKKENIFQAELIGETLPPLLKVVAIYGPNASGKSNLIRALDVVSKISKRKPTTESVPLPVSPFRFDPLLRDKPSRFEIHFFQEKTRYSFELSATADRIHEEKLVHYPRGKETLLYHRSYASGHDEYIFGEKLEGGDALHQAWRKLTGPQVMFLAQAVANSNEELNQLRRPFSWLSDGAMVVDEGMKELSLIAQRLVVEAPTFGKEIADLLNDVDIPISAISAKVQEPSGVRSDRASAQSDDEKPKEKLNAILSRAEVKTTLTHSTSLGEAEFDFEEESEGTKNMFGFALPWAVVRSKDLATNCWILLVDELDSSLHPRVVEELIKRHLHSENTRQLVFTTHDTHLMDTKLLRRDQIWMTERDATGATRLRSIHDFDGREGEDVEKRYFEGRYRSLPLIRRG